MLGKPFSGAINKVKGLWHFGKKVHTVAKEQNIDLFISISSMYAAHVAFVMGKPHIVLDDTEHSRFEHMLYKPFSKYILTPSCFEKHMGKKQIRYDGFHELAYLHPRYFQRNDEVLIKLGIEPGERFSLLRFVSWNAGHDLGAGGLTIEQKEELVELMSKSGKVFISSEKDLPASLDQYRIRIRPEEMHDVLDAATLYVGEGASMASECAMLGTPAIYINSLDAGTLKDQQAHGLLYSFRDYDGVADLAQAIMIDEGFGERHAIARDRMISEKIDVTEMLCLLSERTVSEHGVQRKLITKLNYNLL